MSQVGHNSVEAGLLFRLIGCAPKGAGTLQTIGPLAIPHHLEARKRLTVA
jgi:hypothetical protein